MPKGWTILLDSGINMNMAQTMDHIFQPEMQAVLDRLSALFDVHVAFLSPSGTVLRVGEQRRIARYCRLLQKGLSLEMTCLKLDKQKRKEASAARKMISYHCHAGLREAIIPVYISDELTGFLMIGQFRSIQSPPQRLCRRWRKMAGDDELEEEFKQIPYYPEERVEHILGIFELLVDYISSQHLVSLRSISLLQPILDYMRENLDEPMSLDDVAQFACRSSSTVSHQFKRILGKSFGVVRSEMQMEKAEEYFRTRRGITVKEVASRLGFQDARYFSRFFRKHAGLSPSEFMRKRGV